MRWRVRGLGDRHEFEHFVERHAEDGDDLLGVGEATPLMHRNARLYAVQLLTALSLERGTCHARICGGRSMLRQAARARV